MMGAWIPPQRDRGVPWALEVADVMAGVPKTTRIPTGGWRSYGAVPSNSYASGGPIDGTPYWSGMGMVGSVFGNFGQETKTNPCPTGYVLDAVTGKCVQTATAGGDSTKSWLDMVAALGTAASTAYQSKLSYDATRAAIKAGVPIAPPPGPVASTAPPVVSGQPAAMQVGSMTISPLMLIGGGLALAALFMAMRR